MILEIKEKSIIKIKISVGSLTSRMDHVENRIGAGRQGTRIGLLSKSNQCVLKIYMTIMCETSGAP